jgi:hypothetical protein
MSTALGHVSSATTRKDSTTADDNSGFRTPQAGDRQEAGVAGDSVILLADICAA